MQDTIGITTVSGETETEVSLNMYFNKNLNNKFQRTHANKTIFFYICT